MQEKTLNKEGLFVSDKPKKGFDPFTAEYTYFNKKFIHTQSKDDSVAFIAKSNGITTYFARFTTKLIDGQDVHAKVVGNFIKIDEDIFNMYKGYIEKGHYAGYVEANNLIGLRGLN